MEKQEKSKLRRLLKHILLTFLFGVMFVFSIALIVVCAWYSMTYNLEFKELLYTLASPLKGTGESTISLIISTCLPPVLWFALAYVIVAGLLFIPKRIFVYFRYAGMVICSLLLVGSLIFSTIALRIPAYVRAMSEKTHIYENYYVDPDTVQITADGKTMRSMPGTWLSWRTSCVNMPTRRLTSRRSC